MNPSKSYSLEILHKGENAWNAFRRDLPSQAKIELTHIEATQLELNNYNLDNVSFSKSRLPQLRLDNCSCQGANFFDSYLTGARISNSNFLEATLPCALLPHAHISNCSFIRSDLMGVDFADACLENVDLRYARMEDGDYTNASLKECKIYGASIWSVHGNIAPDSTLIITPAYESEIVTKDLELSQYFYQMNRRGLANMHSVRIYDPILRNKQKDYQYHLFLSHASEDKEAFVQPLAESLTAVGLKIWYDDISLSIGSSIREEIDKGLNKSLFGLVVLSKRLFQKSWPVAELNAIFSLEMAQQKFLIPLWYDVDVNDVINYSPLLADRRAIRFTGNLETVALQILRRINDTFSNPAMPL